MRPKGRTLIFDIDGTICKTINGDYENAKPIQARISKINRLYKDNYIIYFTSRGYKTGIDWLALTQKQFKKWKVKFHQVIFGKPFGDLYVGDEAMNDRQFFKK